MDKEIRKKILEDYRKVNDSIGKILSYETPNFRVIEESYIGPTIIGQALQMEDKYGNYIYLRNVRDCLEKILSDGKALFKIPNAPDYVSEFIN